MNENNDRNRCDPTVFFMSVFGRVSVFLCVCLSGVPGESRGIPGNPGESRGRIPGNPGESRGIPGNNPTYSKLPGFANPTVFSEKPSKPITMSLTDRFF